MTNLVASQRAVEILAWTTKLRHNGGIECGAMPQIGNDRSQISSPAIAPPDLKGAELLLTPVAWFNLTSHALT